MSLFLKGTFGAVTTDGWTSVSGHAYYGFTYHWIDGKWVLHSIPIGIAQHTGTTTGPDHAVGFEAELEKHGLTWNNVVAVTTDTEPTMNVAGLLFIEKAQASGNDHLEHIVCLAHILNLVTKKVGVDPTDLPHPQVENCPYAALEAARAMCTSFSKSSQLEEKLLKSQAFANTLANTNERPKRTIQDIVTRWWSTYTMIARLLHLRLHIGVVCNSDPDSVLVNLTEEQWALLKDIVKILEPFMLAQELMEGEKYVTLSLVPTVIERVRSNLREASLRTDHSEYVARMLKVLTDTFTAEWGSGVTNTQYDEHKTVGHRNRHKG